MSAIASLSRLPSFMSFDGTVSGASSAAEKLRSEFGKLASRCMDSASGGKRFALPQQVISEIFGKCQKRNWNGEDAEPIDRDTANLAKQVLLILPSYLPTPEIFADPTGAIAFEWYRRPRHRLVISIYGSGTIEFAGLLGVGNEVYGAARVERNLPPIVGDHLRQLFTD